MLAVTPRGNDLQTPPTRSRGSLLKAGGHRGWAVGSCPFAASRRWLGVEAQGLGLASATRRTLTPWTAFVRCPWPHTGHASAAPQPVPAHSAPGAPPAQRGLRPAAGRGSQPAVPAIGGLPGPHTGTWRGEFRAPASRTGTPGHWRACRFTERGHGSTSLTPRPPCSRGARRRGQGFCCFFPSSITLAPSPLHPPPPSLSEKT